MPDLTPSPAGPTAEAGRSPVFVTGATGYIGGRLAPRLVAAGRPVRCLARDRRKLAARAWTADRRVEIVEGDAGDTAALTRAMTGCKTAYYLIHSMLTAGTEYAERDRALAESFARAAAAAGVERIIYLGGLGETGQRLSEHLTSRRDVEAALAGAGVPVTVLRAAMIVGSGSASFEILRYLVERLPVMITPRWVSTECQPIAVDNVLRYLIACLEQPATTGRTLDIGGPEVVTYRDLMQYTAEALGLSRRIILPVPFLTPHLSSLWIHLVTPLSRRIARPLAEGLRNRVVCRNRAAAELMPQPLIPTRDAIFRAVSLNAAETSWTDAGPIPGDPDFSGGTVFEDEQSIELTASPRRTFKAVCRIGGGNGWYAADFLWRIRGVLDRLVGGPGLRRGRRDPETVGYGDALDFWRVTGIEPNRSLALRAEMKLPGEAELRFRIEPLADRDVSHADGPRCRLIQTACFKPRGLAGLLYWYAVLPFHGFVFRGMLEGIRRAAEEGAPGARNNDDHEKRRRTSPVLT